jgi:hypothetical protein
MKYCFDIDGTLCTNTFGEYHKATPLFTRIDEINGLYALGHEIKLFTARGTGTGIDWSEITTHQLAQWGVKYHELIFGKPEADIYVDDRGQSDLDFFGSK